MAAKPAIDLSTIGMKVAIAFETIAGTRPTDKYYNLQKPKSIPDMNPEPDTIDTTSLNATKYKTSVPGLLDLSGAMGFTFGMSQVFIDTWDNICNTWDKNKAEGKGLGWKYTIQTLQRLGLSQLYRQDLAFHLPK